MAQLCHVPWSPTWLPVVAQIPNICVAFCCIWDVSVHMGRHVERSTGDLKGDFSLSTYE